MTDKVRRLLEYHFVENETTGMSKRTVDRVVKGLSVAVEQRIGLSMPVMAQHRINTGFSNLMIFFGVVKMYVHFHHYWG